MNCVCSCASKAADSVKHTLGLGVKQNLEAQVVVEIRFVDHCCWFLLRNKDVVNLKNIGVLGLHGTDGAAYRSAIPSPDSPARNLSPAARARPMARALRTSVVPTNPSGNPSEYTVFWSMSRNLVAAGKLSMILYRSIDASAPRSRQCVGIAPAVQLSLHVDPVFLHDSLGEHGDLIPATNTPQPNGQ